MQKSVWIAVLKNLFLTWRSGTVAGGDVAVVVTGSVVSLVDKWRIQKIKIGKQK